MTTPLIAYVTLKRNVCKKGCGGCMIDSNLFIDVSYVVMPDAFNLAVIVCKHRFCRVLHFVPNNNV